MIRNTLTLVFLFLGFNSFGCDKAPDFKLRNQEGDLVSLNDILKRNHKDLIFLSIFQTTCLPCIAEITALNKIQKEKASEANFELVLLDSKESREETFEFMNKHSFAAFEVLSDPFGKLDKDYKISTIPKLLAISKSGEIIKEFEGKELSDLRKNEKFEETIMSYVKKPKCAK